jgi:threonine aldolase
MIDLYSDTMTKPTLAMRRCMAEADVGDEQKGEDPTVNRLQELVAELLGKEAAVYLPSGTMCNEIENTHNMGGGSIWPLAQLQGVCAKAHQYGLMTHLDGARLLNAVVATGIPAMEYAEPFDSVWIDLSKGLGCPVGAVLAGSREFIKDARRLKHLFGGAMRQAGIIAAAGVYALEHHVARLAEDHAHATMLAQALAELPSVCLDPAEVETNIVIFDVAASGRAAEQVSEQLEKAGVRVSVMGRTKLRAVTHLDVTRQDIERAMAVFRQVL